jgi:1,4-dihydroxy-2-naphthoate octaprenyltransferase
VKKRSVIAFVRLGRPQFLVGGFLLHGLGAAVAVYGGASFHAGLYALGQAAITTLQLMTHYANDYFDLAADRANTTPTRWSGGSRVLPSGTLSPRIALQTACVLAAMGLVLVGVIGTHGGNGGPLASATLLLAGLLAWAYSAPPLVLHSRGLGEFTTAVVVAGLTPAVAFTLQVGDRAIGNPSGAPVGFVPAILPLMLAILPLFGLQFVMLLTIEFPDAAGDAAVGKRTLVVRLGAPLSAGLCRAVLVTVYGSIPLLIMAGLPPSVGLAVAAPGPIAAWQFLRLGAGAWGDARQWESLAFRAVGLLVATAAAELAAFVLLVAGH